MVEITRTWTPQGTRSAGSSSKLSSEPMVALIELEAGLEAVAVA